MPDLLGMVRAEAPEASDRDRILDAALAAFLDFGIRRTSMSEVARRAGLSPATLYRRYAQKNLLVQALGLRETRRFLGSLDRRVDRSAPAAEQLVELFVACASGMRTNRLLARLIATDPEVVVPLLTGETVLALGRDYLAGAVRRLQTDGKLADYDPAPAAELLSRVAVSLALTPATAIPTDPEAMRRFARAHVTVMFQPEG